MIDPTPMRKPLSLFVFLTLFLIGESVFSQDVLYQNVEVEFSPENSEPTAERLLFSDSSHVVTIEKATSHIVVRSYSPSKELLWKTSLEKSFRLNSLDFAYQKHWLHSGEIWIQFEGRKNSMWATLIKRVTLEGIEVSEPLSFLSHLSGEWDTTKQATLISSDNTLLAHRQIVVSGKEKSTREVTLKVTVWNLKTEELAFHSSSIYPGKMKHTYVISDFLDSRGRYFGIIGNSRKQQAQLVTLFHSSIKWRLVSLEEEALRKAEIVADSKGKPLAFFVYGPKVNWLIDSRDKEINRLQWISLDSNLYLPRVENLSFESGDYTSLKNSFIPEHLFISQVYNDSKGGFFMVIDQEGLVSTPNLGGGGSIWTRDGNSLMVVHLDSTFQFDWIRVIKKYGRGSPAYQSTHRGQAGITMFGEKLLVIVNRANILNEEQELERARWRENKSVKNLYLAIGITPTGEVSEKTLWVDGMPEDRLVQLEGLGEQQSINDIILLVVRENEDKSKIQFVSFGLEDVLK